VPHVGRQEAPEVFTFKVDDAGPYEFVLAREHLAHVTAAHERIKEFEAALRKIAVRDFSKAGLRMIAKQALNGVTLND
jgi:hypothetical protein